MNISYKKYQHALVLGILLACLTLPSCCIRHITYNNFKPKPKGTVRVVTYNLDFKRDNKDHAGFLTSINALKKIRADIMVLQEASKLWRPKLRKYFSPFYKYRVFSKKDTKTGLAILSKDPIKHYEVLKPPIGRHEAILAVISSSLGMLQVMNIHLQPPLNKYGSIGFFGLELFRSQQTRLQEIKYLYKKLKPINKTIIAGDFNEDYPGKASNFLYQHGFHDALWMDKTYSKTWCYRCFFITFAKRLDHQYSQGALKVVQVQVLQEGTSDHMPVVVDYSK